MSTKGRYFAMFSLLSILILSACIKQDDGFEYERVFVSFSQKGGQVPSDQYFSEYALNGTAITYSRAYANGTVSYFRTGNVSADDARRVGKYVVDAGIFGMASKLTLGADGSERPSATLQVSIDGRNKTVTMSPYMEEYAPGNVQKLVFELKALAQGLQS